MIWSYIIFSILLSTRADQLPSENTIKEAQQKIMVFLKEPTGVSWLTSLTQRQKSALRTSQLLTSILEPSCPASPETKSAASNLQKLLTTENATQIEFEGWKDLMDNGPQDDVICLYRALNTTLNHTEDWQKFIASISDGYMVYLALDMGTKYIICMKKIPVQARVDAPTEPPPTTTPEAPGPKMGNGSRALNDDLPLSEDSCEETTEKTQNSRRQFEDLRPTSPPPCNRPIIYVLPVNYPVHAINWYPAHGFFYQKNFGPYEQPKNFGPYEQPKNFGPYGTQGNFGPYAPQSDVRPYGHQVGLGPSGPQGNFGPYVIPKNQGSQETYGPQGPNDLNQQGPVNVGPYVPYRNFGPTRSTYGPNFDPERTTKNVRPNFLGINQLVPIRRSPYNSEQIGPNMIPEQSRHWRPPPKCDKNTWRPECFWKPTQNRNQVSVRPTMIDNNFGYRKTLPVKEQMGPKENPITRFWQKSPFHLMNWAQKKIPELQIQAPVQAPVSTGPVPWIVYNRYSVKYPPGPGNFGYWQGRPRTVIGPVGPVEGAQEQGQENGCGKNCLCNLCNKPIVVKVLLENSEQSGPNGDSRRSLDAKTLEDAISKTDKNLEEVERKIQEMENQSNESEIEESTESSEG